MDSVLKESVENKNVTIHIFYKNELLKIYDFDLHEKIINIKKRVLCECFENKYNEIDFENTSEKIYKDFGKLFFDKGMLPNTIDNYKLDQFTESNRTFFFTVHPKNIEKKDIVNQYKKREEKEGLRWKQQRIEKKNTSENNGFLYREEDFPSL